MQKEIEMLKVVAKLDLNDNDIEKIESILKEKNLDWSVVLQGIFKHKIVNIFFFIVKKNRLLEYIPNYVIKALISNWEYSKIKMKNYKKLIKDATVKLNERNIPYALIKGFDTNDKLYFEYDENIREFNDLDLFVSEENLTEAEKVFIEDGFVAGDYSLASENVDKVSRYNQIRIKMGSHQIYNLVKKINFSDDGMIYGPLIVDINFEVYLGGKDKKQNPISTKDMLETRKLRENYEGIKYYSLDEYYTLVQLIYHFYRETTEDGEVDFNLHNLCDIHLYLKHYADKWNLSILKEIIMKHKMEEVFWFALYFVDVTFETSYMEVILDKDIDYSEKYKQHIEFWK